MLESSFDHPYYIWNKRFMSILGTWPSQTLFMRTIAPFFLSAILMSILIPEIVRMADVWGDITIMMDCISPPAVMLLSYVQLFNNIVNREKFIKMLNHISSDWKRFENSPEIRIINKYAARGCKITKTYSLWMYVACVFYLLMPIIPAVMNNIVPLNESRTKLYLFEAEYGVISNDYYWPIIGHSYLTSWIAIIIIISNDVMFFVMVEHACALFEITGSNLQALASNNVNKEQLNEDHKYKMICRCINLHRDAIAGLIESTYAASFVGVIGFCLLCLSITGVQAGFTGIGWGFLFFKIHCRTKTNDLTHTQAKIANSTVLSLDQPEQVLRYSSFCLAQIFHLYFNSIPGQKIIDCSLSIFEYAYSINWPDLTPKSQKLLMLIMMRSMRRCQITAGKIYIVSMESYSTVMQTSMSYFTFLTSML